MSPDSRQKRVGFGMQDEIEAIFDRIRWLVAQDRAPGICAEVDADGERFSIAVGSHTARGDRPITAETRFPMGCISKSLMALACADLHLSGRLDLQAPVTE